MVYICAWQAPPLQPERWISSSTAAAAAEPQARAAVFLRDQHRQEPGLGQGGDELGRILPLAVQGAPIVAGEPRAQPAHRLADFGKVLVGVLGHHRSACSATRKAGDRPAKVVIWRHDDLSYVSGASTKPLLGQTIGAAFDAACAAHPDRWR